MMGYKLRTQVFRGLSFVLLALVLVIVLFPIYWMLVTAFKPKMELYKPNPTLWPSNPTFEAALHLFQRTPFFVQLRNSVLISGVVTSVAIVASSLAGYSISRLRFPGRDFVASSIFFTYLIPGTMTLIPLYVLMSNLGLLNSLYCLMLSFLSFTVPYSTWMLKGYFTSIPMELEEAAMIDGCTRLGALARVVFPLAAPGVAAVGVYTFTMSWNQYLLPMLFNNKEELWTMPVALAGWIYGDVFMWGEIMSGALIMSFPVLILYFLGQRFLVAGLTAGAVKG